MPELIAYVGDDENKFYYGYFVIMALMISASTGLYIYFRKHKWI